MDIKKEDDRSADYQVIRRYAHDMRNDINAIKLGVVFLESQKLSDDVEATIHRITRQLAHSEMLLQFLALRFEEPTLQALTAMDLYTMWAARCRDTQAHRNILGTKQRLRHLLRVTWEFLLQPCPRCSLSVPRKAAWQRSRSRTIKSSIV